MRKAFIMNLKNGNKGLAVRLKAGETPRNTDNAVRLSNTDTSRDAAVWLFYGPSVDQVFKGVADDVTPDIQRGLTREFFRQFIRLSGRG